jgi:thiosulfate dehydrogenase
MRSLIIPFVVFLALVLTVLLDITQDREPNGKQATAALEGVLIPASATMTTAWDIPRNPLSDSTLKASPMADQIRWGFRIFTNTSHEAPQFSRNKLSCNNCHLNGGQKEKAMPLVGVAAVYPEYNKRAGRTFSLEDRIVGCFTRSQNATGGMKDQPASTKKDIKGNAAPSPQSKEVRALAAYLEWLSEGYPVGKNLPWRGQNTIPPDKLLPVDKLDPIVGAALFKEKCSSCHGEDGQGVQIGDKKAGPLWGPDSWNDGAGAARVYTLAGMIRHAMPYLNPGSLTDEEAQHIAAFINSKPRPEFPFKNDDYRTGKLPPDAVYYKR